VELMDKHGGVDSRIFHSTYILSRWTYSALGLLGSLLLQFSAIFGKKCERGGVSEYFVPASHEANIRGLRKTRSRRLWISVQKPCSCRKVGGLEFGSVDILFKDDIAVTRAIGQAR